MYGNVDGTSQFYDNVNGTEGLHCTSTSAEALELFSRRSKKKRRLGGQKGGKVTGLNDQEFSRIAKYLSEQAFGTESERGGERYLVANEHEHVIVKEFPNGVEVVSTFRLS